MTRRTAPRIDKTLAGLSSTFAPLLDAPDDGVTSALAAFQAAINAGAFSVPDGDYLIDGSLTATGSVDIRLAPGARILVGANAPVIEFAGAGSGSSRGLQAQADAGQSIIQCNTVGLDVGDWILVRHPDAFPGTAVGSKTGELHRVRQIDSTVQLRTMSNLDHTYPVTTASVVEFTMIQGIRIAGGEFVNNIGATLTAPTIRLTACADIAIDTSIRGAGGPGITLSGCTMFDVSARVRDSINDAGAGNYGYGVELFGASCHGRVYVDMVGGRHAFTTTSGATTTGVPRHIVVRGIAEGLTETAWDTHEEGEFIDFDGVRAFGCRNGGVKHRAPNSTINYPIVRNSLGIGVRFAPTAAGGRLHGGYIDANYLSAGSPGVGVRIEAADVTVSGDPTIEAEDQGIEILTGVDGSSIRAADITAGLRANASTEIGVDYQGTSSGHRLGAGVSTTATTGVSIPGTVGLTVDGPRRVDLEVLSAHVSHTNFSTVQNNSASWMNTRRLSSGAQNDEVVFVQELTPGSWMFELFHDTSTSRGIYTVSLADVTDGTIGTYEDLGTIDGYAASGDRAVSMISGVAVTSRGQKAVRIKMATKNASSSGYFGALTRACMVRSA